MPAKKNYLQGLKNFKFTQINLIYNLANHQLKENILLYCDTKKNWQKYNPLAKATLYLIFLPHK
jgi:hypothetical protein